MYFLSFFLLIGGGDSGNTSIYSLLFWPSDSRAKGKGGDKAGDVSSSFPFIGFSVYNGTKASLLKPTVLKMILGPIALAHNFA